MRREGDGSWWGDRGRNWAFWRVEGFLDLEEALELSAMNILNI